MFGWRCAFSGAYLHFCSGSPLLKLLEELPLPKRDAKAALRIPILDKLKDSGKLIIQGKVESGTITLGQKVVIMPGKVGIVHAFVQTNQCSQKAGKVISLATDLKEIGRAGPGENVRFTLSSITEDHVRTGFVVCNENHPILAVPQFEAQIAILDLLPHKVCSSPLFAGIILISFPQPIFSPGYQAVFHCHTCVEECTIKVGTLEAFNPYDQPLIPVAYP